MMRSKTVVMLSMLLVVAGLAVGCAKPPQEAIDAGQAALTAAEGAEAATYAANELTTAREALAAAQAEVEAQNGKFAMFRSYEKAEQLFADAQARANEAAEAAVAGKAAAKQAAEEAVQGARDAVAQAQALIGDLEACKRRPPKGFAADMATMKGSVDGLAASLAGLDAALAAEDFSGASSQAESLSAQAGVLVTDLEGAKSKLGC